MMTVHHRVVWCKAEEEGQEEYLLALESSEMANLRADVATAGFVSGAAMSPGRLLRVAHALSRAILMTFSGTARQSIGLVSVGNAIRMPSDSLPQRSPQSSRPCEETLPGNA